MWQCYVTALAPYNSSKGYCFIVVVVWYKAIETTCQVILLQEPKRKKTDDGRAATVASVSNSKGKNMPKGQYFDFEDVSVTYCK